MAMRIRVTRATLLALATLVCLLLSTTPGPAHGWAATSGASAAASHATWLRPATASAASQLPHGRAVTLSATAPATVTATVTPTATLAAGTVTPNASPTATPTLSATATVSASATATETATATVTTSATTITATETSTPTPLPSPTATTTSPISTSALRDALTFEPNAGQSDPAVRYLAHGPGYTLFLTDTAATLAFLAVPSASPDAPDPVTATEDVLQISYVGANPAPVVDAQQPQVGLVNYFVGGDPSAWHTGIPTYASVTYHGLYPGIDLVYQGRGGQLDWAWDVAPGADPSQIQFTIQGAAGLSLDAQGNLVVQTALGAVREHAPVAYQVVNGQEQPVSAQYTLSGTGQAAQVGLNVGAYNTSLPLVIDPLLSYSSFLGGSGDDQARHIALDSSGNIYVTGDTTSADFPVKTGSYSTTLAGGRDAFVTKLSPDGGTRLYSTYLGGSGDEHSYGLAVDSSSHAYLVGSTTSSNFPISPTTAAQPTSGGGTDAFVVKLNQAGSNLIYSTYLGGSGTDTAYGVALDSSGHAYVTGETSSSANFPTTPNVVQPGSGGGNDAFVTKVSAAGTSWLYSTYLGGSGGDHSYGIAVDSSGNAYVTGRTTSSTSFPLQNALQGSYGGVQDAFVTKLNSTATSPLLYSTFLGGSDNDEGRGIAVDSSGNAYVTGDTLSTDFPITNAVQSTNNGGSLHGDAFVSKINAADSALLFSTYLGGSADEDVLYGAIALDSANNVYIAGSTASTDFPTENPVQGTCAGSPPCTNPDAFVTLLDSSGNTLGYSTYLGGSGADYGWDVAVDGTGTAYVTGQTASTDFPTTTNAFSQTNAGGANDAFITKINPVSSGVIPWHARRTLRLSDSLSLSVDLADGHADLQTQDMLIPGRGPNLDLAHVWDSTLAQNGLTSTAPGGWLASTQAAMGGVLTGTVLYTDATTAAVWAFPYTGNPSAPGPYTAYHTPNGLPWQLSTSTSGYTLTNVLNGTTLTFDNQGRYLSTADAYSNAATLTYSAGQPITWTAAGGFNVPGGRAISLAYTGSGLLSDAQSPLWRKSGGSQGRHVTYSYNGSNQLTTLVRGAGTTDAVTETFGYSGTQLVTVTTGAGHQWTVGYDANGRVNSVTSPASGTVGQAGYSPVATTEFSYAPGQSVAVAGFGSSTPLTTTYTLDVAGEATAIADGLNDTSTATYDQDHDVLTSTDPDGNTTTNYFAYVGPNGSTGLITETVQPPIQPYSPLNTSRVNPTTLFFYNATNDLTETIKPEGGTILYGYDGHHSVITTTELVTGTSTWRGTINQYDADGELTGTIDGRAISVNASGVASLIPSQVVSYTASYTDTANGDLASVSTPPITTTLNGSTTIGPVTTTYGYGTDGDQTSMTTPNGNAPGSTPSSYTTTYSYNHLGQQTKVTQPSVTLYTGANATPVELTSYDGDGNVVQEVDANGGVTSSSYDPQGRLVSQTNPVSGTVVYTYTTTEQSDVRDPQGNVTAYGYDAAGRLITTTAPISGVMQYQYDPAGNTVAITTADTQLNPIQVDTRQYDALNRLITDAASGPTTTPLTTTARYDKDGNSYQTVYPASNATVNTYDLADDLVSTENDTATVATATHQEQSTKSYDAAGNQVLAVDFGSNSTSTTYDADNRVVQTVSITDSSTVTATKMLDPDANVLTSTIQTAMPAVPLQTSVDASTYNAQDWTTSTTDNGLTTSYGYDAVGQERTRTTAGGTITTTLDAEGRPISITATGAGTANYGYNQDNQPITASLPGNLSGSMSYNQNDQLASWSVIGPSTGVTTSTVNLAYTYTYNGAQQVSAITATDNGVAQTQPVTHDAAGRMIGWGSPNGPNAWGFDGDGDVISTTSFIAGAIRTTVFTYSNTLPKELVQQHTDTLGVDNYTYDGNGNLISEVSTDPITSPYYVNQHFWFDPLERPITITNVQNGATVTATLGYNAQGQNITYTVVMSGQVIDNALYSYDTSGALVRTIATTATLNGNGTIQSSGAYTDTYAYDPLGQPLFLIRQQNGTTKGYTYLLDGHGSVVGLVDSAGNRVNRYQYAPYGAPVGLGFWETVPQLFRNAGTTADPGLGLTDPDGNPKNCCSDTSILANKAVGFLSYITFNADPLDYELAARRLVNGLLVGPIVRPADAGVGVGAGAATAAGTICVTTIPVPFLGEIDCATAIALFGVAFVASLFYADEQAVPVPIPDTRTKNREGTTLQIFRELDAKNKSGTAAATNPGAFKLDPDGVSMFEVENLPGIKPFVIGFFVRITTPKVPGVTGTMQDLPGCAATYTPDLPEFGDVFMEGHWSVNCAGDTPMILSTYAKANPKAIIPNPRYRRW